MLPPFELRVLRYFIAVAEELHFGHAAARLHIAQPSLSVQVRNLERSVGTPLLVRSPRGVSLTPAGEVLLDHARALLAAAEVAAEATRRAAQGVGQRLVVGFQANAAAELTPRVLAAYRQQHPEVHLQMRSYPFADPTAGLADGSADVAFIRPPMPDCEGLRAELLFTEPRILAMPDTYRFASRKTVFVEELLDDPFVARHAPEIWRDFWLAIDVRGGHPTRIGADVKTVDECFEAILSHQGIAFTQSSTQRFYNWPGLAFVPVEDLPPSTVSIAWREDTISPTARAFITTAQTIAATTPVPEAVTFPAAHPTHATDTPMLTPTSPARTVEQDPSHPAAPARRAASARPAA